MAEHMDMAHSKKGVASRLHGAARRAAAAGSVTAALLAAAPLSPPPAAATSQESDDGSAPVIGALAQDWASGDEDSISHLREHLGYSPEDAARFLSEQPELMGVAGMAAMSFPDHVGGAYFDHDRDGILVLPVAADDSGVVKEGLTRTIATRWPDLRQRIEFTSARVSLTALEDAAALIEEQLVAASALDWSIGFDHSRGTVELLVSNDHSEIADAAVVRASAEAGVPSDLVDVTVAAAPVIVEESSACTSQSRCDPPFRGGLRISGCTSGFMAQNSAGTYYTMTAGHCGSRTYSHRTDSDGTRTVGGAPLTGTYTETGFAQDGTQEVQRNSRVDAARIYIPDPGYWRRGRNVFLYSNVNYSTMLHAWSCPANLPQHTFLHRAGGISGTSTGTVRDAMYTYSIDGVPRRDKLRASYNDEDGDSGAPVLVRSDNRGVPGATGIAIHKGRVTVSGETWRVASHIRFVEDVLEIRMRDSTRICS